MQSNVTVQDINSLFKDSDFTDEEKEYLNFHGERFAYTVNLVQKFVDEQKVHKILDIGPHFLTYCLKKLITPEPKISTLGFIDDRLFHHDLAVQHIQMDLNDCEKAEVEFKDAPFDLIIFAETIEHLYTSPKQILEFLKKLLKPEDGGLLIQTPNAASITKRAKLLTGQNPYELIRPDRTNPGHFREYTLNELFSYAHDAGFKIWHHEYCTYWSNNNFFVRLAERFPAMREGMTVFLKN